MYDQHIPRYGPNGSIMSAIHISPDISVSLFYLNLNLYYIGARSIFYGSGIVLFGGCSAAIAFGRRPSRLKAFSNQWWSYMNSSIVFGSMFSLFGADYVSNKMYHGIYDNQE